MLLLSRSETREAQGILLVFHPHGFSGFGTTAGARLVFQSFPLCIVLMVFSPTYLPDPFLCGTLYMEKRVRNN